MACSIKVERIGNAGVPIGAADLYEVLDEANALTIAAFAVETSESGQRCVATILDTAGHLLVSYAGQSKDDRQ